MSKRKNQVSHIQHQRKSLAGRGNVDVALSVYGQSANTVTINIK